MAVLNTDKSHTTIWKYEIDIIQDRVDFLMPKGAKILDVQMQGNKPLIWACVNENARIDEACNFRKIGTGNPFPKEQALDYIGTIQMPPFVWHIFEEV